MNIFTFAKFVQDNKSLVNVLNKECDNEVVRYCCRVKRPPETLLHGTSEENAQKILQNGFKIDYFNGTKDMGSGIYLTEDEGVAQMFGKKILSVKTKLKNPIHMDVFTVQRLDELKKSYIDKFINIISKNRQKYMCNEDIFQTKLSKKLAEDDLEILASVKNQTPEECAAESIIRGTALSYFSNLFTSRMKKAGFTSFHVYDDGSGFMFGRDMNQWVITKCDEIKKISLA